MYKSTKIIDGFSTCFRQWKAKDTHCKFLHGYAVSFKITFEAKCLDARNWVQDFGFLSRSGTKIKTENTLTEMTLKQWFNYMFDHTVIISEDDPYKEEFLNLELENIIQLRIVKNTGTEMFAKLVYDVVQYVVSSESGGRVQVVSVECFEHNKNSAIYER